MSYPIYLNRLLVTLPFDAGFPIIWYYFGACASIALFFLIVFIEAAIMRHFLSHINFAASLKYSFFLNIASSVAGLPVLFFMSNTLFNPNALAPGEIAMKLGAFIAWFLAPGKYFIVFELFKWLLLAFAITVIVECIGVYYFVKPKQDFNDVLKFTFAANIVSYLILIIFP